MLGKLEGTASINTSGVGLGLSTCKKIAEALNGDIYLLEDD
jgi:signal transduction histidine kinase